MTDLKIVEIDHINQLIGSADEAADHYTSLFGVQIPEIFRQRTGPYDNFICKMGDMTLEVFSPVDIDHSFGRQHQRFGNCWQACLMRVPDLSEAIKACQSLGVPLVDVNLERGWAFTDPRSTYFSIQLEDKSDWDKSVSSNSVGIVGLHGFSVAVKDGPRAVEFFRSFVNGAHVLYEEHRPGLGGSAVGLNVGGYAMEIQSPTEPGLLSSFLDRYRQRIRNATWCVANIQATADYFAARGIDLVKGSRPHSLAILA